MKPLSLKARALRLLAQREHSRTELARKLARHAESPDEIEPVLDALQANGWINETRVVESVVHQKAARLGAARIRQELRHRGVEDSAAEAALDLLKTTEYERACAVWQRKFGAAPAGPADYARQMRFLTYRGFEPEIVRRVIAAAGATEDDDWA